MPKFHILAGPSKGDLLFALGYGRSNSPERPLVRFSVADKDTGVKYPIKVAVNLMQRAGSSTEKWFIEVRVMNMIGLPAELSFLRGLYLSDVRGGYLDTKL